jgi:hypothetical protein
MSRQFLVFLGIGLLVVAIILFFTVYGNRGAHLTLEGKILKVRALATDEKNSILVVDFRVSNDTKTRFVVREGVIKITAADGKEVVGETIARSDMNRVFDYYKLLGPKYNEILIQRDTINGGQSIDRMLAGRFEVPVDVLEQRKNVMLTLNDVDGPSFTFTAK